MSLSEMNYIAFSGICLLFKLASICHSYRKHRSGSFFVLSMLYLSHLLFIVLWFCNVKCLYTAEGEQVAERSGPADVATSAVHLWKYSEESGTYLELNFKLCLLVFKAVNGFAPSYLSDLCCPVSPRPYVTSLHCLLAP